MKKLLLLLGFCMSAALAFAQAPFIFQVQNNGTLAGTQGGLGRLNLVSGCTATYSGGAFNLTCGGGPLISGNLTITGNLTVQGTTSFTGNVLGLGTSGQTGSASLLKVFGGTSPTAGGAIQGGDNVFANPTYLYFDPTVSGVACLNTAATSGACAAANKIVLPGSTTSFSGNTVALTADWTCGTGGTVASCAAATIIGSGGGVPLTFTLPLAALSYTLECDGVVGQATAATANQWNLLTATNGATNVTANYSMATAATASAYGAVTDQASTTTTFQIAPAWTLGGTATKMPFHIWAKIEGASASGTVVSLQLLAPTVGDLVTIYRGTACIVF